MSRASEWAKRKPKDLYVGSHMAFVTADDGEGLLFRLDNCELTPTEAVTLAHWILTTFGTGAA